MTPSTKITIPGQRMTQGGRTVYVTTPTVSQLLQVVPERVNPDVIEDANRRLYIPHGKAFGDYLLTTKEWVSGAMLAGVTEDAITASARGQTVTIDAGDVPFKVKLFDGGHRRYGFDYVMRRVGQEIEYLAARLDVAEDRSEIEEQIKKRQEWAERLLNEQVVLMLYVEEDIAALQQMYADISKVRIPDVNVRTQFDRRDPFNVAALELASTHPVLREKVEMQRPTVTRGSSAILSISQLATMLRTLFGGVSGRVADMPDARAVVERGTEFLDDLAKAYDTFDELAEGRVQMAEVRERGELPANSTIIRILAAMWRELHIVDEAPRAEVVDFLSTLPTKPSETGLWVEAGVLPAKTERATPLGRAQEMRKAVELASKEFAPEGAAAA